MNARKNTLGREDALKLLEDIDEVVAVKGRRVMHVNLKQSPAERETVIGMVLGPTGNLRAPTLRKGRRLVVGFNEEAYAEALAK